MPITSTEIDSLRSCNESGILVDFSTTSLTNCSKADVIFGLFVVNCSKALKAFELFFDIISKLFERAGLFLLIIFNASFIDDLLTSESNPMKSGSESSTIHLTIIPDISISKIFGWAGLGI